VIHHIDAHQCIKAIFMNTSLPIAIIGAGPVGLAAAAHALTRGETPLIFEAGTSVGANMLSWGHVRLFTPWQHITDSASRQLLEKSGWQLPDGDTFPTGAEVVQHYLRPLAQLPNIHNNLRLSTRVISVARQSHDKMKSDGRDQAPFVIHTIDDDGRENRYLAKAVIDASGTYTSPNPLGANGVFALGERAMSAHLYYGIPDVLGTQQTRYANKTIMVVGSGHSAFNAILDLVALQERAPQTTIIWAVRRSKIGQLFGGGDDDALSARGALGSNVRQLVETGRIRFVTDFHVTEVRPYNTQVMVIAEDNAQEIVDEVIVTTGFRPDLTMLSELRLDLDTAVESPRVLAPLIDPNLHSCGTVRPHGAEELRHPENNFYIVGMKSYGRAPTFLLLTGYEQARSVVAAIVGDWQAARDVQLVLPETGVCVTNVDSGSACCGVGSQASSETATTAIALNTPQLITLTAIPVIESTPKAIIETIGTSSRACGCEDTCCS
jgi:thioredoxin reductase